MHKNDVNKTAFVTYNGLYKYNRMSFGFKTSPVTFQRAVDVMLANVKWQYALGFLEYVIVFLKRIIEYLRHIKK